MERSQLFFFFNHSFCRWFNKLIVFSLHSMQPIHPSSFRFFVNATFVWKHENFIVFIRLMTHNVVTSSFSSNKFFFLFFYQKRQYGTHKRNKCHCDLSWSIMGHFRERKKKIIEEDFLFLIFLELFVYYLPKYKSIMCVLWTVLFSFVQCAKEGRKIITKSFFLCWFIIRGDVFSSSSLSRNCTGCLTLISCLRVLSKIILFLAKNFMVKRWDRTIGESYINSTNAILKLSTLICKNAQQIFWKNAKFSKSTCSNDTLSEHKHIPNSVMPLDTRCFYFCTFSFDFLNQFPRLFSTVIRN